MSPRLLDFAEKQAANKTPRIDDIAGNPVIVQACALGTGSMGDYADMDVLTEDGEILTVRTWASLVVDALARAQEADAFPLPATFKKRGRPWIIE